MFGGVFCSFILFVYFVLFLFFGEEGGGGLYGGNLSRHHVSDVNITVDVKHVLSVSLKKYINKYIYKYIIFSN